MMSGSLDDCLTLRTEKNSLKEDDLTNGLKNSTADSKLASGKKKKGTVDFQKRNKHCLFTMTTGVCEFSTLIVNKFVV